MELYRPSQRTLIPHSFFERDPVTCARELVGCLLVWDITISRIVETEAYDEEGDEACHTFFKPSARHFVQAHAAGTAYVYFNYGVHWMLNVLVKGSRGGFVLIRALEPLAGIDSMMTRRGTEKLTALTSGPGKLTKALGIEKCHHGIDLCSDPNRSFHQAPENIQIQATERIGINRAQHLPWRFVMGGNPHVSGFSKKKVRQE